MFPKAAFWNKFVSDNKFDFDKFKVSEEKQNIDHAREILLGLLAEDHKVKTLKLNRKKLNSNNYYLNSIFFDLAIINRINLNSTFFDLVF